MTESEAIKRCEMLIKGFSVNHATYEAFAEDGKGYPTFNTMREFAEACKYALEEVEQYRVTGLTPSMVKDLIKSCQKHHKNALENAHIVDEYRAIEEELRASVIDEFYDEVLNFEDYIEPIEERNGVLLYSGRDITNMIADIKRKMKGEKE